MKTIGFRSRLVCALVAATASSMSFAATFTDANWISMGGIPGAAPWLVLGAAVDGREGGSGDGHNGV